MRLNHDLTPRLTGHARQRCQEMGVSTKVVKAIYKTPAVTRPARSFNQAVPGDRVMVKSDHFPGYAIVVALDPDGTPVVVSLLFDTGPAAYVRNGTTPLIQENQK